MKALTFLMHATTTGVAALALTLPMAAQADQAGRGLTRAFEIEFMQFTIDHHFAALRITELAAGTDPQRTDAIAPGEGTSPTPGFAATPAKASLDDLKSLARRNNRMQREEIQTLKTLLRDWYAIDYQPKVRQDGMQMIQLLEQARPGSDFNHKFLETFARHHYTLMEPINACLTGSELKHEDLRRECRTMWHSQIADIDMIRHELERHFGIVDYRPFHNSDPFHPSAGDPKGEHSGSEPILSSVR